MFSPDGRQIAYVWQVYKEGSRDGICRLSRSRGRQSQEDLEYKCAKGSPAGLKVGRQMESSYW